MVLKLDIDFFINWFGLTILKYPILLYLPFLNSEHFQLPLQVYYDLILYSALLRAFLLLNSWFKCTYSTSEWSPLSEIDDLNVLVTGGSNGLGKALIETILTELGEKKKVNIINIDISNYSGNDERVHTYLCDLTIPSMLNKIIDTIYENVLIGGTKQFHLIINNAGMRSKFKKFEAFTEKEIRDLMQINSITPVTIIQRLSPLRNCKQIDSKHKQCYIVNIASSLGILAASKVSIYAASKAALISFHNSLKFEILADPTNKRNIKTLLVIAGQLNTEMFSGFTPPRQFFAPIVDVKDLSRKIINKCNIGEFCQLNEPFYANFAYLLMSLPLVIQWIARKLSGMDNCLPDE
ncbi:hypothetical protein TPHA_0B01810 [Tetrapisispora phaffii CBS 4417]|uniref:Uncharacterized protein n=1 Tax=Tetrapisispora phaffii (strain ATCC 24235 / CBS 4417 / NBRC 1672 / NRRL Y-8282 / UCD 70-5) TaxID=1071381 RepID=G8BPC3_TETPH|nr:hypothetical protein TPHA_0B01810 [Tetrapisispora phaffii CBS 4417]CCE61854.1 hypothetical protein TPHA_0B01810 [Tetrapisispora phaffii CBS 4417]